MMAERIQKKLKICTGHDWREVKPSYINFRLQNNKSRPQMCVFSPDDITKQRARLFIPEDARSHELHRPDIFLEKYLNAKQAVVKNMPWVKFDLDEFPEISGDIIITPTSYAHYAIKLTGDVKLRKMGSKNTGSVGLTPGALKKISANAKIQMLNFINTLKVNFDSEKGTFSFGESILGPYSSTSLTFTPPTTMVANVTPSPQVKAVKIDGWEIQTELGYSVTISLMGGMPPETTTEKKVERVLVTSTEVIGIVVLVIFCGWAIGTVAVGGAVLEVA